MKQCADAERASDIVTAWNGYLAPLIDKTALKRDLTQILLATRDLAYRECMGIANEWGESDWPLSGEETAEKIALSILRLKDRTWAAASSYFARAVENFREQGASVTDPEKKAQLLKSLRTVEGMIA